MDTDFIINKLFHVYGSCAIVFTCLYMPQLYIKYERKDKSNPSETYEKVGIWISCIMAIVFMSFIYSYHEKFNFSKFISAFIIMFIPVALSLNYGFEKDRKLTLGDRKKIKKELEDSKGVDSVI